MQCDGLPEALSRSLRPRSSERPATGSNGGPGALLRAAAAEGSDGRQPQRVPCSRTQAPSLLCRRAPRLRRALHSTEGESGPQAGGREAEDEVEGYREVDRETHNRYQQSIGAASAGPGVRGEASPA